MQVVASVWDSELDLKEVSNWRGGCSWMCLRTSSSGELSLEQRTTPSAGWNRSTVVFRVFLIMAA